MTCRLSDRSKPSRFAAAPILSMLSVLLGSAALPATARAASLFDPVRHMHTSEVTPGMKGYGLSVFSGTTIARFDVEVLSVMRNQAGPKHDIVLIRCSGQGLEHSGAIEGMSGSPIYLTDAAGHDRLIGAFALGWENDKDPIAGVRPIEEMLDVSADVAAPATRPAVITKRWNATKLIAPVVAAARPLASDMPRAGPRTGGLRRLSLPLTVSGVDAAGFARLLPWINADGLTPLQGGGVAGTTADASATLVPGATIGLPIVTGDLDLSAIGTVTEVIGKRLFAFGHEFNAEGAVDLPMGVGYVHTVIPSSTISFKIGSLLHLDGAIHNDESTAIAGTIGDVPAMIPVTVSVRTPQRPAETTYHFRVARHPKFTPMGAVTSVMAALMGHSSLPTEFTVRYAMKLKFDNGQSIDLSDTATSVTQGEQLARDLNLPLTLALQNPFARTYPSAISARFDVEPVAKMDEVRSAVTDKQTYKPGETIGVSVTTLARAGVESSRRVSLDLPDDLAEGDYTLTVGDADRYLYDEMQDSPGRFDVRSLDEVFGLIREVTKYPSQKLYVRLSSHEPGVSVGRTALRSLPPSKLRVLTRPGQADVLPFVPSISESYPWDAPLQGAKDVEITVSRTPQKTPRPAAAGE